MNVFVPQLKILDDHMIQTIIGQAWSVLETIGVEIEDTDVLSTMKQHDLKVDSSRRRVFFTRKACERYLETAPGQFCLYSRDHTTEHIIGGRHVHYDPGSAAVFWLDPGANTYRRPVSRDCKDLAILTDSLPNYHFQSTGIVPSDVPEPFADCHRLIFALTFCSKSIITGTFRKESFGVIQKMLEVVAGNSESLRKYPIAVFDCCPSPPLRWSTLTLSALLDCARSGIPAEIVSMPLAGATAPATLIGAVVQHTAESLSGVLLHQITGPGSPIVWGGSPAAFDMRYGTTPMGSMETMMIDMAYTQIGKTLNLPTHAYMACSDAKIPDYQAGMETGIGAVLAALSGINIVSGPGFLNYENTQSMEKLVMDHDTCNLAYRLIQGIHPHPELDPVEIIARRAEDGKFLFDQSTRQVHRQEIMSAGKTVFRGSADEWIRLGSPDTRQLAQQALEHLIPTSSQTLDRTRTESLVQILLEEADRMGIKPQILEILRTYLP